MKRDLLASNPQRLSRSPRLYLNSVAVRRYHIPRHGTVEARLWRLSFGGKSPPRGEACRFAIELQGLGMRRLRLLEGDETRARAILSLLVENTVTPCALGDVLEEL